MKRLTDVWNKIIAKDNLYLALNNASRGRTQRPHIKRVLENKEEYIEKLYKQLKEQKYKTSNYSVITLYVPKKREIYRLPFYPDRIIHHAIINILEPFWMQRFQYHSYACQKGKGQHKGSTQCMIYVRKYKYVLKCDISKFFPSVDHTILKNILSKQIKDKILIKLLYEIIDSVNNCKYNLVKGKNIPIGNLLSQWLGNVYLNELDKYVKYTLKIHPYIRYCDDFLLFSNNKKELHEYKEKLISFIESNLKLKMSKCSIFPVTRGVDFLGYRHFPKYILLRKRTVKRWNRFFRRIELPPTKRNIMQIASFNGITKWANSFNYKCALNIMNKYTDIKKDSNNLEGTKISIKDILNKNIIIYAFRTLESRFHSNETIAQFQFAYNENNTNRFVCFTSSKAILNDLQTIPLDKFPFSTSVITKTSKNSFAYYTFS